MIGYLSGKILEHFEGKMVIAMSQGEGVVGYQVTVPSSPEYGAHVAGKSVELFIYTHVREDALDLYGFSSRDEKELFLTLLTVNGIGPKGALGILSKVAPSTLIQCIVDGDKDSLTKIPGIGKKTAERVVLELADSMKKKMAGRVTPTGASKSEGPMSASAALTETMKDARDALMGLGYREQDVSVLLKRVGDKKNPPQKVEEIVRMALQQTI